MRDRAAADSTLNAVGFGTRGVCRGGQPSLTHNFKPTFSDVSKQADPTQIVPGENGNIFVCHDAHARSQNQSGHWARQGAVWVYPGLEPSLTHGFRPTFLHMFNQADCIQICSR